LQQQLLQQHLLAEQRAHLQQQPCHLHLLLLLPVLSQGIQVPWQDPQPSHA
jgi:hypothetical protein